MHCVQKVPHETNGGLKLEPFWTSQLQGNIENGSDEQTLANYGIMYTHQHIFTGEPGLDIKVEVSNILVKIIMSGRLH